MSGTPALIQQLSRISELTGWRRYAVALGFGLLAGLAFAPLRLVFALAIGLSGLALLAEGSMRQAKGLRSAFFTGTAYGTGYFGLTMLWLANAFLVQADQFAWMIPIILPAFFAFLGLFYGLATWAYVWLRRRLQVKGLLGVLLFVLTLSIAEWLRGHILSGLPWNIHAQAAAGTSLGLQPLAALGPYGYGTVLTLMALCPAMVILNPDKRLKVGVLFAGVLTTLVSYSALRLALNPAEQRDDVRVVVVQPNVAQRDKLDPGKRGQALLRSLEMTGRASGVGPNKELETSVYAVWPENAYPFLHRIPDFGQAFTQEVPGNSWLITGSIRDVDDEGYANTLFVFGPADQDSPLSATYDKHRLVPFGETLPFYEVFEALGIESLSPTGGRGFIPGDGAKRVDLGSAPFAPLICYEDVFPGTLYPKGERPDWLVVVTNDAWFGDKAGPMQHLDIARMRAVESGLPLARSANTGISALIDAEGRVVHRLELYKPGVITALLPVARPPTFYDRTGDAIFFTILTIIALLAGRAFLQREVVKGNQDEPNQDGTRGKTSNHRE
ncbi:MAG: apolipoprotein N-acyltransferase [Parvularculaceae bacterium]|nr:apolipoprotein N-acyltransferase [Parvularculaceae bacterium]